MASVSIIILLTTVLRAVGVYAL